MVAGGLRVRCEYVDSGSEERRLPLQFPISSAGVVSGSTDALTSEYGLRVRVPTH